MLRTRDGRVRGTVPCAGCGLTPELCACPWLEEVELGFDLVVVRHAYERNRGSNTVRLLQRVVPATRVLPFGTEGRPFTAATFGEMRRPVVLFPRGDRVLAPGDLVSADHDGHRRSLIVLDGSWSQCRRMARRVPGITDLPFVRLPPTPERVWKLRRSESPSHVCTFEAVVRAVEVAGSPTAARVLRSSLAIVDVLGRHSRGFLDREEANRHLDAILEGRADDRPQLR
ncbi:MAG: DTW domain-containing protein [Planctomycetes bacterium]|nr:DTW domain-containing protein [Planctomycetota bacterium]MCB9918274.1 DTW domain-containing protein [Planctomycetota bacterium]